MRLVRLRFTLSYGLKKRMGILVVIHTFGADMKWHPQRAPPQATYGSAMIATKVP